MVDEAERGYHSRTIKSTHGECTMIRNVGRRTVMKAMGAAAIIGIASDSAGAASRRPADRGALTTQNSNGTLERDDFKVILGEQELSNVRTVSLPTRSVGMETRRGRAPGARRRLGETTFDDLEMERGVNPGDTRLWDWQQAAVEGRVEEVFRELTVVQLTKFEREPDKEQIRWEFQEAWVKEYDPPDLDASADGEVATESITVAFDRMTREEV